MKNAGRRFRLDEFVGHTTRAIRGLDRGIAAVDSGDELGYDEILRTLRLLAVRSQGCFLLPRLSEAAGIPLSSVLATLPPHSHTRATREMVFGLGAIPIEDVPRAALRSLPERVSLVQLMTSNALLVRGSWADPTSLAAGDYSWDRLVRDVANKAGTTHLDDEIPAWLEELFRFRFSEGVSPVGLAIRALAVAVRRIGLDLLRQSGRDLELPPRSVRYGVDELWLGALQIYGRIGGQVQVFIMAGSSTGKRIAPAWKREAAAWFA